MNEDEQKIHSILKKRADKLAQKALASKKEGNFLEAVLFRLAKEIYAIDSALILEVYPVKEIAPLPCVPPFIVGLLNVRRKIYSVTDLRILFGMPVEDNDSMKAILLRKNNIEFAILAEAVLGVRSIYPSELQPPLSTLSGVHQDFLKGILTDGTIVLNGEQILSDHNIIVEETVD